MITARRLGALCVGIAVLVHAGSASAVEPSLLLHVLQRNPADPCAAGAAELIACDELRTESSLAGRHWLYLAAAGIDTLGGASFNLRVTGRAEIFGIEPCNGVELLSARTTGDVSCIWVNVPTPAPLGQGADGIVGIAAVDAEGAGAIEIVPCYANETAVVWDGSDGQLLPQAFLGRAVLGGPGLGHDPCRTATPTALISWGRVKATF